MIPARSSVTTREVRAAVASPEFDELARAFDEVVYGHRDARPDDLEKARSRAGRACSSRRRPMSRRRALIGLAIVARGDLRRANGPRAA